MAASRGYRPYRFFQWFDEFIAASVMDGGRHVETGDHPSLDDVPRCKCGSPASIKVASTTKSSGRQFYVCSARACDYFRWCDENKWRKASAVDGRACTAPKQPAPPPNEYALLQSEEAIRKDIVKLQASLNDPTLLANLPDRGERMRLKLDRLSDALAYKEAHPDPAPPPKPPSGPHAKFHAAVNCPSADVPTGTGGAQTGTHRLSSTTESLDARVLEESLARKSNVTNVDASDKLKSKLYPHQQLCFSWMYDREQADNDDGGPRGGIVADDMGLGKTIQMIALILSSFPSNSDAKASPRIRVRFQCTLIVCPLAVATQWSQEILRHTHPNSLRVRIHHGKDQLKSASDAADFDVVITTYQTALSSFKQSGVLHAVHWVRVILDEAHIIKNHKTATAKAVFQLESQTRWLMTATPLQNHLRDMFSVFKFLRYAPFCEEDEWNRLFESQNPKSIGRLRPILQGIMIRRTKEDRDEHGNPLIVLPPKHLEVYRLKFRADDRQLYDQVDVDCRQALHDDRQLLVRVLRLRQACNCMIGPITRTSAHDHNNPESVEDRTAGSGAPFREVQPSDPLTMALNQLSIHSADEPTGPDRKASASVEQSDDADELVAALNGLSIRSKQGNRQPNGSDCFEL